DAIARHEVVTARKLFDELLSRFQLDAWGRLAEGRLLQLEGNHEAARGATLATMAASIDEHVQIAGCHRLIDLPSPAQPAPYIETRASVCGANWVEATTKLRDLRFRLSAHRRDFGSVGGLIGALTDWPNQIEDWVLADALFELDRVQPDGSQEGRAFVDALI